MNSKNLVRVMILLCFCCVVATNGLAGNYNFGNGAVVTNLSSDTESLGQRSVATKGKNVYMVVEWGGFFKSTDGGHTFGVPVGIGCGMNPEIALSKDGTIYVSCFDGGGGTYVTKTTNDGSSFSPPVFVGGGYDTSIAVDDNGDLYVTSSSTIFKSSDGGATFMPLNTSFSNYEDPNYGYQLVVVAKGGKLYVVWTGYQNGIIRFAQSSDGGMTFSEVKNISGNASSWMPSIAVDDDANIYLAWVDASGLYISKSLNSGVTFTTTNVAVNATNNQGPTIAVDTVGSVYVAWQAVQASGSNIFFTMSEGGNNSFSSPNRISDGSLPTITVNGSQDALIGYGTRNRTYLSKSVHCTD